MWYAVAAFIGFSLGWLACALLSVAKWADEAMEAYGPRHDDEEAIGLCD